MSRRVRSLSEAWADRLGIEAIEDVNAELAARFEHLSRFVLAGEMPRPREVSAEAATACGELWVLAGFLADARRVVNGQEVTR